MCQCMKTPNWCRNVGGGTTGTRIASIGMLEPATKEPKINDIFTLNTLQINKTISAHRSTTINSKCL